MKFDDYNIDEEDYKFFTSLPADEKILFVYDLICEEFYGSGSSGSIVVEHSDMNLEDRLSLIVDSAISYEADVNVLILNNQIILNSNVEDHLHDYILDMFMRGYIMVQIKMTDKQKDLFHKQLFCRMFKLLGIHQKIYSN